MTDKNRNGQDGGRGRRWRFSINQRRGGRGATAELYPLPEEFPTVAVLRLLAALRGGNRDPQEMAHAIWHLAGYGLAMSKPKTAEDGQAASLPVWLPLLLALVEKMVELWLRGRTTRQSR